MHTVCEQRMAIDNVVLDTLNPLQANTTIVFEDEPTLLTARNDGLINSFNFSSRCNVQHVNVRPAWWASIDMLHIVSS